MNHEGWLNASDVKIPGRYVGDGGDDWRFKESDCLAWECWDEIAQEWIDVRTDLVGRVFRIPPDEFLAALEHSLAAYSSAASPLKPDSDTDLPIHDFLATAAAAQAWELFLGKVDDLLHGEEP